jgi:hypothetical protein
VLTNKAFYKFDVDAPLANPRKKKELLDIHRYDDQHREFLCNCGETLLPHIQLTGGTCMKNI